MTTQTTLPPVPDNIDFPALIEQYGLSRVSATMDISSILNNERNYIERVFKIADKHQKRVPFKLNYIQDHFDKHETGKDIIVKPAQVGFTSLIIAKFLYRTMMHPDTTSVIIAYEDFITQRLLSKAQAFYDSVPEELRPKMHHRASSEKFFGDINSVLYIGSARSFTFARGEIIHNALLDEYAFYLDPVKIANPILDRGINIYILSTANGAENSFHDFYVNTKEGVLLGESRFTPHCYLWFNHEEYSIPEGSKEALPKDRDKLEDIDSDEQALLGRSLTEDQLRWRRMKKSEKELLTRTGETVLLFDQEYPSDDETCFLAAGDMAYDAELINDKIKRCTPPLARDNEFSIWELPDDNTTYWISIDPGLGKITRSVVEVWRFWEDDNLDYGKLCAIYAELSDTEVTAEKTRYIGHMYHMPGIGFEANGHGEALVSEFRDWPRLYTRKDIVKGKTLVKKGWLTTTRTKPYMIKELRRMLPRLEILDARVLKELKNIREQRGLPGKDSVFMSIGMDDMHDATAIAVVTRETPIETSMQPYGEEW